jgi:hypothetical protein
MREIANWLEKLGMSENAQCFAENRIDFSVLPKLTDQHLKDLGIALGDRLKLLRAIRDLGGTPPISPKLSLPEPKVQELAERRQVTVEWIIKRLSRHGRKKARAGGDET